MKALIIEKDNALKKLNELNYHLEIKVKKRTDNLNQALQNLRNAKKIYKNIFDNAGDGIFRVSSSGQILNLNNAAAKIFGYSSIEEVFNLIRLKKFKIFINSKKKFEFIKKIKSSSNIERFDFEAVKKNNEKIWVQIIASKGDEYRPYFIIEGIIRDITNEKKRSDRLLKKAFLDPLTKIYNREGLYEHIDQRIKKIEKFSLFFMDLDGFKKINDDLGHKAGDDILKFFTKRILKNIRDDDIVGRFGGDEFILLVKNLENKKDIETFSNNLINNLSSPYRLEDGLCKIGVSVGISRFPKDFVSRNQLISNADKAMYTSKQNGKNRWTLYKREFYERT